MSLLPNTSVPCHMNATISDMEYSGVPCPPLKAIRFEARSNFTVVGIGPRRSFPLPVAFAMLFWSYSGKAHGKFPKVPPPFERA